MWRGRSRAAHCREPSQPAGSAARFRERCPADGHVRVARSPVWWRPAPSAPAARVAACAGVWLSERRHTGGTPAGRARPRGWSGVAHARRRAVPGGACTVRATHRQAGAEDSGRQWARPGEPPVQPPAPTRLPGLDCSGSQAGGHQATPRGWPSSDPCAPGHDPVRSARDDHGPRPRALAHGASREPARGREGQLRERWAAQLRADAAS
jgi:hypothetical protein